MQVQVDDVIKVGETQLKKLQDLHMKAEVDYGDRSPEATFYLMAIEDTETNLDALRSM